MPCCGQNVLLTNGPSKYGSASWNLAKQYQGGCYNKYALDCKKGCANGNGWSAAGSDLLKQLKAEDYVLNTMPKMKVDLALDALKIANFH